MHVLRIMSLSPYYVVLGTPVMDPSFPHTPVVTLLSGAFASAPSARVVDDPGFARCQRLRVGYIRIDDAVVGVRAWDSVFPNPYLWSWTPWTLLGGGETCS